MISGMRMPPVRPRIAYPAALPIAARRADICASIRRHPVVIITGETGSGKTTQIPKMCLEAGRGRRGIIGCTQPRRVAAVTVARRIAEEMGEALGQSVGYKIRFEDRSGVRPLIKLMTDGILLVEAQSDPLLRAYDTIMVDEAHERSLNIDFTLGLLKNLIGRRRDLKVIITSATIDTQKFSQAFGDAPIIEVSGRMYPVEVRYEPIDPDAEERGEVTCVEAAVRTADGLIRERRQGDMLIFMPTEQDILESCELLEGRAYPDCVVLPLFARLPWVRQRRVFEPVTARKIVVATNVAETSITIPGIRYVIDTGLARLAHYSPRTRTTSLPVRPVSRSSADQRKGRCGRVQNGLCIRLYSEEDFEGRPPFTTPEILRANLAEVILRMLSLNLGAVETFPFIDAPNPRAVLDGLEMLQELGAVEKAAGDDRPETGSFRLTARGRSMARLPLDPRIARMLLEAQKNGCLKEMLVIASAMTVQDPRERPPDQVRFADQRHAAFRDPASDFITLLRIWQHCERQSEADGTQGRLRRFCREHFLSYRRMREWRDVHDQLRLIMKEFEEPRGSVKQSTPDARDRADAVHQSILSGYLSNIAAKQKQAKNLYTATKGRQVMIFPGSSLFNKGPEWIVAAEIVETSRLFARTAAAIDPNWLEDIAGGLCRYSYAEPHWEANRGEVVAAEQVSLFGLVIVAGRPVSYGRIDPEASARIFVRSALVEGQIRQNLPFLAHNRKLITAIESMEDRIRRRGLLADEDRIASFYEQRLPGICDLRSLQKLIRDRGGDAFLRMSESDLLADRPDEEALSQYPQEYAPGKLRLRLSYRFEPGHPEDGVTMKIPVHLLSGVPSQAADGSVPGLLREKIGALLKGLPKEYRRKLQPLAETADFIRREMPPPEGPLAPALGEFLFKRLGVHIPASAWPLDQLPDHLKMRFSVVDERGREMASGRDLEALRFETTAAGEGDLFAKARVLWEKTGLSQWDFGDLPGEIPLERGEVLLGIAYPALEAAQEGVNLRLFRSRPEADRVHARGVAALYGRHFQAQLKHLKKALVLSGDLKVWAAAFGGPKALEGRLYEKVLQELFARPIRTEAEFHAHAETSGPCILSAGQALMAQIRPFVRAYHETVVTLRVFERSHPSGDPAGRFLKHLRGDLDHLVPPDFLLRYDAERLRHVMRYLKALLLRAERGLMHLEKDNTKAFDIKPFEDYIQQSHELSSGVSSAEKRQALEDFRWMVEEYKVSLFAQELKTPYPVSRKRLEHKRQEMERMI